MGVKVRVKVSGKYVMTDVYDKDCPTRVCFWNRQDPGIFTQGVGYRERNPGTKRAWLCGTREIHGCPVTPGAQEEKQ